MDQYFAYSEVRRVVRRLVVDTVNSSLTIAPANRVEYRV